MRSATLLGFKMKNLSTLAEVIQKNSTIAKNEKT
jgi:hypothetical protein